MRLVNWRTLVASAASVALVACGDDVTVVTPPPEITPNPASISCQAGSTTALGVSIAGGGAGTPTVTFTSSGPAVTVAGSGTGATVTCAQPGSAVITITVTQGGQTATSSVPVTVTAAPNPITAILLNPEAATIAVGGTQQMTATVLGTGTNLNTNVTYRSTNTAVATVSATGLVTGVAPGQTTIIATSVGNPALAAAATITVVPGSAFVTGISVSPSTVTLEPGNTQILTPLVTLAPNAPAGTSRNVTCVSSNTAVATVTGTASAANCTITAVANGTATITVRSEAAPDVATTVTVTVRAPLPVRLTIQSVRVIGPAGTLVPADLNNVAGNLWVTLNLDPGDFRPDSVQLRLGSQRVNCQRFPAAMAEALRRSLQNGSADVQTIECQVNTSQFNAQVDPATGNIVAIDPSRPIGAADVLNGSQPLIAEVFYRPQGAAAGSSAQQRAEIPLNLTVNNQSGFFVQVTNTPTTAQAAVDADGQATGPQGVVWRAGSLNVRVLPVNFVSQPSPGQQSFTITLQDANGVVAQRTAAQDQGAQTFTATFPGAPGDRFNPNNDPVADRSLNGYTSPNAGQAAIGPNGQLQAGTFVVIGTQAGTGNTVVLNAAGQPAGLVQNNVAFPNTVGTPFYVDNQRPQPAIAFGTINGPPAANFANTGTAFVGFVGGQFNFANSLAPIFETTAGNLAGGTSTTNNDFNGVDRVAVAFFASTTSNTAGTITSSGTRVTTGSDLAPSTSNTTNNLAVLLTDALGNARSQRVQGGPITSTNGGTGVQGGLNLSFGVDISAPTLSQTAGPTTNQTFNQAAPVALQFAGQDDIGFGANPLLVTVTRTARAATGNGNDTQSRTAAPSTFCATSIANGILQFADDPGGTCNPVETSGGFSLPPLNGQYAISVQARDQAGNLSNTISRIEVIDFTPPSVQGVGLPQTLVGNQPATFPTSATDNLELGSVFGQVGYAAIAALRYPTTTIGTAFDNVFTASNTNIAVTIPQFIRSVTAVGGTGAPAGAPTLASRFTPVVADIAGNQDNDNTVAIPASNISGTPANFTTNNPVTNVTGFTLFGITGNNAPANTVTISGGNTANTATSATIRVLITGAQNTFISPFQRIELYVAVGTDAQGAPVYQFVGTVPAGFVQDNPPELPGGRLITGNFTLTPTTSPLISAPANGQNTYSVVAVGVTANGDALISNPVTVNIVP